ncbi:phage portal protein [Crateriforma conspicua]|uniref:Phage portal protein, lambda family n=1 Tax=Crateriforma conspicua TaxID=2527996 RepID=A0A5C5XSQ0_9PLAN|nr:phage portal protein [Crateriforma conspicua]QDV66252.1 Phage portal protein, lambda family [Crateriforma conspicua]TWT65619.1 Phage portal protein, lambda family [Crateriforma conspicua]
MNGQLIGVDGKPLTSRHEKTRRSLLAKYDAAQTTPGNRRHWEMADLLSPREANNPAVRQTLRSRSRYEVGNNSFASGIIRSLVNDIVGRGPRLQIDIEDGKAKQQIEQRFRNWWRRARMTRQLRTAKMSQFVDGETFIHAATNPRIADRCQLACRVTEADQITNPSLAVNDPKHDDGIHFDDFDNPVRYERLKHHPGDAYGYSLDDFEPVPAEQMIHLFRHDRPGVRRGIPVITPALPLFGLMRRYTLAVVRCAEHAAHFSGIFYTDHPNLDSPEQVDPLDEIEVEMGMFMTLPEGWKMGQLKAEQPVQVFEMFRNAIVLEIARCVLMPKNKALGDSGGYNLASGKLDFTGYSDMLRVERDDLEIEVADRIFQWWLDEALLIPGYLPTLPTFPDGVPHSWIWDQPKPADELKAANAAKVLWEMGLMTDEEYLRQTGKDPDTHYQELQRQRERREALGLPLPGQSGATSEMIEDEDIDDEEQTAAEEKEGVAA